MSQAKITPGATPSRRLTMQEFVRNRMQLLDDNHTKLLIKKLVAEKDLEHTKDQVTMHEGAVLYLKQMVNEWAVYASDTTRLRVGEEAARAQRTKEEEEQKHKEKLKRKRRRKSNG